MQQAALITGASSGIGAELARCHARRGGDVVLVARRRDRLETLAAELTRDHGIAAQVLPEDLADPAAPARIVDALAAEGIAVEVLVNNAGYGAHGNFHEQPWPTNRDLVQVNCTALIELTHRLVPAMVARGRGRVLNVGSTAGFVPGPLQATYYASKAFVNTHSQALSNELRSTGVTVTVLCPGPVATEFGEVAGTANTNLFAYWVAPAARVAEDGYRAMERGRPLLVQGWLNKVLIAGSALTPRPLLLAMSRFAMEKRKA